MDRNEYAKKYNLDLSQADVIILYHPEEVIKDFVVYFPNKQQAEIENNVKKFAVLVPKSEFILVTSLFPNAQVYTARSQTEVLSFPFDDDKEKYLEVKVVLKNDKFYLTLKHGGWHQFKNLSKDFKEPIKKEEPAKIADNKTDPMFKKYQKVIRLAENLTLKKPTTKKIVKNPSQEK